MALTIEEKIIRLRRGIASPETSDSLRAIMQADLDELLNPTQPTPEPVKKEKKTVVKKAVKVKEKKEEVVVAEVKAPELTEDRKKAMMDEIAKDKAKKLAKQQEAE